MKEIESEDALVLVKQIVEFLNGISVGQALWVLHETKGWIMGTHEVNSTLVNAAIPVSEVAVGE